jgi:hypothetical protein
MEVAEPLSSPAQALYVMCAGQYLVEQVAHCSISGGEFLSWHSYSMEKAISIVWRRVSLRSVSMLACHPSGELCARCPH